jgi:hypothetical protein
VGTGWFSLSPFSRIYSFFGNPGFYCFFDGASQIALFSAESLDGFESELLFQLI